MRRQTGILAACVIAWCVALAFGPIAQAQDEDAVAPIDQAIALLNSGQVNTPEFDVLLGVLREQAENGDALAMNFMGVVRANNIRTEGRPATYWYRRAVEADHETATAIASLNLYLILRADPDPTVSDNARELLENVARGPDGIEVHINGYLGHDYLLGLTGPANPEEGEALLDEAIAAGFNDGSSLLAYSDYLRGRDTDRARGLLRSAARSGNSADAAWHYAQELLQTGGSEEEAFAYVVQASDQGLPVAHISRAVMLATGQGTPLDQREARNWYVEAMAYGSAHAARGLGGMVLFGEGGEPDIPLGYGLLELAANAGDEYAPGVLRVAAQRGIERPDDEAIKARVDSILAYIERERSDFR